MKTVALGLDDVAVMSVDRAVDDAVMLAEEAHPGVVAEAVVERRGVFDVGEEDRHLPIGIGDLHQVGALHFGPARQFVDGTPHHPDEAPSTT